MTRGEVVLIRMQFHEKPGSKVRPAVVLFESGDDDFIAAPVTSQRRASEYDVALDDWELARLNVPSFVRVHKLTVLSKLDVVRVMGGLSRRDEAALWGVLCHMFCAQQSVLDPVGK